MKSSNDHHFPHERLDAFWVALELAVVCQRIADGIPRGYRHVADQLQRAGTGVPLLVAEGANRASRGQKRQRFEEARGECGEAAAAARLALALKLANAAEVQAAQALAGREAAMLTKLIQRFS